MLTTTNEAWQRAYPGIEVTRRGRSLILSLGVLGALLPVRALAQEHAHHDGMNMPMSPETTPAARSLIDVEEARNASGTAWQPENTPHAALHAHAAGLDLMFHTLLFAGYDVQGSDRGAHEPMGVGWLMGMASRRFETSRLSARVMLSPEPWTAGYRDGGYPLLLQTGETVDGRPLHDRQHPHDLFMELGALYTQGLGDLVALQLYAAAAGEPALGPVAFPHRASASADPLATLTHHWQDSTHISFGVVTFGVITRLAKLEASWFNGREPDETRYDLDLRRPDSYAVRLSLAPGPAWSGQVSYGYLASPESLRPDTAVHRLTASLTQASSWGRAGHWASTMAFGANKEAGEDASPSLLLETNLDLDGADIVFGRAEVVEKSGHDLVLTPDREESQFWIAAFSLGYLRNFGSAGMLGGFLPGVGVRGSLALTPGELEAFYGTRVPLGAMVYLRIAVAPMAGH